MTRIAAPVPWRLHRDRLLPLTAPRALEAAAQLPQAPPASRAAVVARARPRVGPPPCRPRRSPAAEPPPLWHPSRFSTGPPARGVTVLRSPPAPPSPAARLHGMEPARAPPLPSCPAPPRPHAHPHTRGRAEGDVPLRDLLTAFQEVPRRTRARTQHAHNNGNNNN